MLPFKKNVTFLLLSFLYINTSTAQFGVRIKYDQNTFRNWENAIQKVNNSSDRLLGRSYGLGLDYWFKMTERRIEFNPELAYTRASYSLSNESANYSFTQFQFNFNTNLYALDMGGDCNCPTFSKQGDLINKGLFFHLTPGVSYYIGNATSTSNDPARHVVPEVSGVMFRVGAGVGLDIGVSDLLTITPIISYYFNSAVDWAIVSPTLINSNLSQVEFTLRLGFRPDYGRRRFR